MKDHMRTAVYLTRIYRPKKTIENDIQKEEKEAQKSFVAEHAFIDTL